MFLSPLEEARALIAKGDADGAIPKLMEYLNGDFYHDEALYLLGGCFIQKGHNGLGAVVTSAAVDARASRKQPFPEALLNLGSCYKREFKNEIAEKIWLDALKQEKTPRERSKIYSNIAGLYVNEGQPEKAVYYCDQALKEDPKNVGVMVNRGLACLELGRWEEGWFGLNHTYLSGDAVKRTYRDIPEWDGSHGKTVIVWGDQGIGDEIYYAQCLGDMQKVCKRVILDGHPRLENLLRRSFPEIEVHGTRKNLVGGMEWVDECGAEATVAISRLPMFFRNTDESWGDGRPYLTADRAAYHLAGNGSSLRIGLAWTGGTKRTHTHSRSIALGELEPILKARPDAQWFSLQYAPNAAREVCELEERTGIRISHYPGWVECFDYDRTASFVSSLDLVITVTTTVHDLASAIGVPNWVLVPSRPPWRYQLQGEKVPWYNVPRLYRQVEDGDWSHPINRIAQHLETFRPAV